MKNCRVSARKGTIITMDVAIALVIGAVLLVAIAFSWSTIGDRLRQESSIDFMMQRAASAASMLMDSEGSAGWCSSGSGIPGLLTAGKIDARKVSCLSNMSYDNAKNYFSLGGYDIRIELKDSSATILEKGLAPSSDSNAVSVQRAGLFGNNIARLVFTIWKG